MKNSFFNYSVANIYTKPSSKAEVSSQILYGEKFKILSKTKAWFKIKTSFDNYIGYIKKNKFNQNFEPNYKIYKLRSRIFKKKKINFYQQITFFTLLQEFRSKINIKSLLNLKKIDGLKRMI